MAALLSKTIDHYSGWQLSLFRLVTAIYLFFIPLSASDSWLYNYIHFDYPFLIIKGCLSGLILVGFQRQIISLLIWLLFPMLLPFLTLGLILSKEPLSISKSSKPFKLPKYIFMLSVISVLFIITFAIIDDSKFLYMLLPMIVFLVHPNWFKPKKDNADHPIIFFDGVCTLCNYWVNFCLTLDSTQRLRFAPIQGDTAAQQLPEKYVKDFNTIVFYQNGTISIKSTAALNILSTLGGIWFIVSWLRIIPPFIRNLIYDVVAKNRYRVFGKEDTCRLPLPHERSQFYD